jgi:peptidyl-prolyl cis-trans isomerase SurA
MKKWLFITGMSFITGTIYSQVLFTYGDNAVSKQEFLRAYQKNNAASVKDQKALNEYLNLYTHFKLKVKAAEVMRLDTVEQLKYDLQSFRSQIEEGYLNDEAIVSKMVEEAYDRSQKDIRVSHFSVQINKLKEPSDTVKAASMIQEAYTLLKSGEKNYAKISTDLGTKYDLNLKLADLGYITVFTVPYEYENIIYGLKKGEYSAPYRSKNAWHIFINEAERKPMGTWKTAQILFVLPPDATTEQIATVGKRADSIYRLAKAGNDFSELAKKYSEDRYTYPTGGLMPEFGAGKYNVAFEENIIGLTNDGDITIPFLQKDGYHIVKRLEHLPVPSNKNDETVFYSLKQRVANDARGVIAKNSFYQKVLNQIGFRKNEAVADEKLILHASEVLMHENEIVTPVNDVVIFTMGNTPVKGIDWLNYARDNKQPFGSEKTEIKNLYNQFITFKSLDFYKKHLEEYNTDFKYQMQEFKEGNMLFEIMERNVWSKSATDTAGLMNHYQKNKQKYLWGESADVFVFNCSDKVNAEKVLRELQSGLNRNKIAEKYAEVVQIDSGRYELTQIQIPQDQKIYEGYISPISVNEQDQTTNFIQVLKVYPANLQRSFDEARGLVINEYQTFLEEEWLTELKKKYPIKVNKKVYASLMK